MDIRDPIHGNMEFDAQITALISHPYMQRLKHIKQTALASTAYPGAEHTRFAHSLGAAHLMSLAVRGKVHNEQVLIMAALLHDIGHGAYSHLWESITGFDHEEMTVQLLRDVFQLPEVAAVIEKKHPDYLFMSSSIDVDKLDYMVRDAYYSGADYGAVSVDRIVKHITIQDGKLCVPRKSITEVSNILKNRSDLYKSIFFNKHVRAKDALLKGLFKRVLEIKDSIYLSPLMKKVLANTLTPQDFLYFTDSTVLEHIKVWCDCEDTILRDLSKRFYLGVNFMALELSNEATIQTIQEDVMRCGFDAKYYFLDDNITKGNYENEIYVIELDGSLVALSSVDPVVKTLQEHPTKKRFVIGPREVLQKYKY